MPHGVRGSATRLCVACGHVKKIRAHNRCSSCYARLDRRLHPRKYQEWDKARYRRDREKRLLHHRQWAKKNRRAVYLSTRSVQRRVEAIKVSSPCGDCRKFYPPECMDFDHRPGERKLGGVGAMMASRSSWARIEKEIKKCDLVCANCHRTRTLKRHLERNGMSYADIRPNLPRVWENQDRLQRADRAS